MSETTSKKPAAPEATGHGWPADPVAFLLSKGWEPLGDPRHPRCTWLDPTKPRKDSERKVTVGTKTLPNKRVVEVQQTRITPRVYPVSLEDAVDTQLRRDRNVKTGGGKN